MLFVNVSIVAILQLVGFEIMRLLWDLQSWMNVK